MIIQKQDHMADSYPKTTFEFRFINSKSSSIKAIIIFYPSAKYIITFLVLDTRAAQ